MNILVLMSCYNGEKYLREQLNSLLGQSLPCTNILIRDDGSFDDTRLILNEYCNKFNNIKFINEDIRHLGVKASYAILFRRALTYAADYLLIADQDDVWLPQKIEKSLAKIQPLGLSSPALVFSDVKVVDENLNVLGPSFTQFQQLAGFYPVTLKKLLLYSPALGCTMIFNRALASLAANNIVTSLNPDKWLLVLAAVYGSVGHLPEQTLLYRQHHANLAGALLGVKRSIWSRQNGRYLQIRYQSAIDQAREIMHKIPLNKDDKKLIHQFICLFTGHILSRALNFLRFCTTPPHWKRKIGLFLSLFFNYT